MSTIEATITAIQQDASTGWYRITTDDERIKRLDTKDDARVKQAVSVKGQLARITYSEQESNNINPHTNRPYLNRYFESAESLQGSLQDEIEVIQPTGRKTDPDDAWRMCLNKGGELAVATLPLMPDDQRSFLTQTEIATAWAKFFFFTPLPHQAVNTAMQNLGFGGAPQPASPDEPPQDDGIPF